jgi:hypothetical protein
MAETARLHDDDDHDGEPSAPALHLVPARSTDHGVSAAVAPTDTVPGGTAAVAPNVGRTALIGFVVGFVLVTVAVTVAGTFAGYGAGASFGLGAFIGLWGGGGFGFMMGGTVPLARHLDAQASRAGR